MPATPTELRSLLVSLSDEAEADLAALWAQLDPSTVREGLFDVLPALVGDYGDAAATVSADWYDEHRADLNVPGRFAADVAPNPDLGADALAGWGTSLAQNNFDTALALISGGLVKRVMTAGRDTIIDNVERDPQARGWQRKARPDGCAFCQMLAGRAIVYRSRTTADFASHDNCGCTCVPAFGGREVPVKPYTPTARTITDAERARVRTWIAENLPQARG
ncbi:VG15 protein [Williamsia serinedens]|uniref:MuF-like minor capsid protein n=1 Tax=Williamsia serinedens TaxID=391736 RepID=A0ABT1HA24_9NOCA|nr:hypothetical protein [Williamsia serinedens]MCP2162668.1 hypothetical protein [Williamsia serinedens]